LTTKKGGHKSSSNAIKHELLALYGDTEIDVNDIDASTLFQGFKDSENVGEGYVTLTTKWRLVWKIFFEFTSFFKAISNFILSFAIRKSFKKLLAEYQPDIILTVHPCFVGSIRRCLRKFKLDHIPIFVCIIDLVKHSHLWRDKKCAVTYVPTLAMREKLLKKGFSGGKLIHSGFPIGSKFKLEQTPVGAGVPDRPQSCTEKQPHILMVAPSLKRNKYTLKLIQEAQKFNAHITVVCASNVKLKKYLDKKLCDNSDVEILGYVDDMDTRLSNATVLVAKAGPNMILEAVKAGVPVLVTGHILGQEEKNYQYIEQNSYGFRCNSPKKLKLALEKLFSNNFKLLKQFSENCKSCADVYGGKIVATHLKQFLAASINELENS